MQRLQLVLRRGLIVLCLLWATGLVSAQSNAQAQPQTTAPSAEPQFPTQILMLRHALAPGTGDPANFKLSDCTTQRNLNNQGIAQSKAIGEQLKTLGFIPQTIWSSQWCRSLDTARFLSLGPVTPLPVLNSYFQNRAAAPDQIAALRQFIIGLPAFNHRYVMVTHHVVIGDLTGQWVGSGEGVWLVLTGQPDKPWHVIPAITSPLSLP